ncbi:MAG: SAM-dependent DNA methyltransferase [Candidatus Latescibacteria bacterium]|nr:SAM-dependent DNA methyltransferase [Candidatus Latescibacterota bacterium]
MVIGAELLETIGFIARAKRNSATGAETLASRAKRWDVANAPRDNMDVAKHKHVEFGMILLRYTTEAFEAKHDGLSAQRTEDADPECPELVPAAHDGTSQNENCPARKDICARTTHRSCTAE